jgi:CHAT domain-containing protein
VNRMAMYVGYMHILRGDYPAAATNLSQALASFDKELDVAQCREYLGRLHIALGQYSIAREHLLASLAIYQAAHNPMEVARVLALLGQIDEEEGSFARARANFLDALRTFQQVEDRVNESAANFALGKLELKAGDYDRAETYLKQSVQTTEDIRHATIARDLTTAYSATVYERYQTYIECLLHKHKLQPSRGLDRLAFQTSELARARALAELLRDTQSSFAAGVNRSLATRERALRHTIGDKMNLRVKLLAQKLQPGPDVNKDQLQAELDQLEASLTPVQREHEQVKAKLRKVNPLFDQVTEPTAYTIEQIQHDVIDDDHTVLLEFILGQEVSYVWAVTRSGIKTYELPKQQVIAEAAEKVYAEASEEPNDERTQRLNEAAERLAQLVLNPVAAELSAQRLIIVADGPLHYIPFQLLPAPTGTREPLIVDHEIVNTPSASILGRLRQENRQRGPSTKLLAAFGDPVFPANYAEFKGSTGGELVASAKANALEPWRRAWRDFQVSADKPNPETLQPLTYSKFELQRLKELGGSAAFVARGFDASRESLGRLDLSQFAVLHFATHGLLHPEHPELSGVVLSMVDPSGQPEDGFITIPDVYALRAPVDLVVLSACHTGLGKKVRGEGLIGLTSGFMHAGASSVAASLWKADDQATAKLMEYFYANMLEKHMRPAEALRAAQNTMRTTSPWQSPHFWAAFTLQGEYRQPIRIPQPAGAPLRVQHAVGIALLFLLSAGIGWGYWRRRAPAK